MTRKRISTGSDFEKNVGYSRAVVDGGYVFVSGTTGYDYRAMTISDDVVEQAERCFVNIAAALEEAGSGLDEVVRVHYILPSRADFEPCWPVFRKYLGTAAPACTVFFAELADAKMKIEIEVTARLP